MNIPLEWRMRENGGRRRVEGERASKIREAKRVNK